MTRLLLTCIGVLALQLTAPPPAGLAERSGEESTNVVPRPEAHSKPTLTRDGPRTATLRVAQVTPAASATPPHPPLAAAHETSPPKALHQSGPASLPRVLPDARAPPA
jgi:hypothetical protein